MGFALGGGVATIGLSSLESSMTGSSFTGVVVGCGQVRVLFGGPGARMLDSWAALAEFFTGGLLGLVFSIFLGSTLALGGPGWVPILFNGG